MPERLLKIAPACIAHFRRIAAHYDTLATRFVVSIALCGVFDCPQIQRCALHRE